ncbi:MAG: hypothetical protein RSC21_04975 [Cetobacterium sp.]
MEKCHYLTIVLTIFWIFFQRRILKKSVFLKIFLTQQNAQFIYKDIVIFLSEFEINLLLVISTVKVEKGFNHNEASIE